MAFSSAHRWWDGLIRLLSSICAASLAGSHSPEHLCADGPEICWLLPRARAPCTRSLIDTFTWVPVGCSDSGHPSGTHHSSLITKMACPSPQAKTECRVLGSLRVLLILLSEHPSGLSLFFHLPGLLAVLQGTSSSLLWTHPPRSPGTHLSVVSHKTNAKPLSSDPALPVLALPDSAPMSRLPTSGYLRSLYSTRVSSSRSEILMPAGAAASPGKPPPELPSPFSASRICVWAVFTPLS